MTDDNPTIPLSAPAARFLTYPTPRIVDKHTPREFTAFAHDSGVTLCDNESGAFLTLRFTEDLGRLRALLDSIEIKRASTD